MSRVTHPDVWARLDALPRERLAALPTPLVPAEGLRAAVGGPPLWLKRDDLISFGFGGNKVRGLELLLADARRLGADRLITGAGSQSNHVRATAAAAAYAGLAMTAVYWGRPPEALEGNYRLVRLLGGEARFTGNDDRAAVDDHIAAAAEEERAAGRAPYPIPRGGACALGVLGHVLAARELAAQCDALGLPLDTLVLAVGSGATLAGWTLGARLLGRPWRLDGVTVSRPAAEVRERVAALASEAAALLELDLRVAPDDVRIDEGFIGEGYGIPTAEGRAALELAARRQGVFFDPTYTGKAFAAYRAGLATGRYAGRAGVVFVHTGGEPVLFVGPATGAAR